MVYEWQVENYDTKNVNYVIAILFEINNRRRRSEDKSFDELLCCFDWFDCYFKDISLEMLFKATLAHNGYVSVADFSQLCIQCVTIGAWYILQHKPELESGVEYRPVSRVKNSGFPLYSKNIGRMGNDISGYFMLRNSKH